MRLCRAVEFIFSLLVIISVLDLITCQNISQGKNSELNNCYLSINFNGHSVASLSSVLRVLDLYSVYTKLYTQRYVIVRYLLIMLQGIVPLTCDTKVT